MKKLIYLLFFLTILFTRNSYGQTYTHWSFYKVDSLASIAKPQEALNLINKIYHQANQTKNTTLLVKSSVYRMLYLSYLKEDALDTILKDLRGNISTAKQPEKSILQNILGNTYFRYYQQNNYRIANRTDIPDSFNQDIKTWSASQLIRESSRLFFHSLKEKEILQKTKANDISIILTGDSSSRIFRPTLYDILAYNAINAFTTTIYGVSNFTDKSIKWNELLTNTRDFISYQLPRDSNVFTIQALRVFQDLAKFHQQQNNATALADAELKRLKFIYKNTPNVYAENYNIALTELANSSKTSELYSDILVEQAELYYRKSIKSLGDEKPLNKALALANEAISSYPKSLGAKNAAQLVTVIKSRSLALHVKANYLPEQAIAVKIDYKNIDTLTLKVYLQSLINLKNYSYKDEILFEEEFKNREALKTLTIALPKFTDYENHSYIQDLAGLPIGNYIITAQTQNNEKNIGIYSNLTVSNLIAIQRITNEKEMQYKVVNATDGTPVKGAKIKEAKYRSTFDADLRTTLTNNNGIAISNVDRDTRNALIVAGADSVIINVNTYHYNPNNRNEQRVILFADRAIYRPGQTVYFKGIFIEDEGFASKLMTNEQVEVSFLDVNNETIEEKKLTTNEFGSFQGAFTIPIGKLNGTMTINTGYGRIQISVEEYKRPTFEVVFDKAKERYRVNEKVTVKGRATSLAGYSIADARVTYKVTRNVQIIPFYYAYGRGNVEQVSTGETTTDKTGAFAINFEALVKDKNKNYDFSIMATITAPNGETRENSTRIIVGNKDILLTSDLYTLRTIGRKADTIKFYTTNLNGEAIKTKIDTKWSLLEAPNRLTNDLFTAENYSLTKEEFERLFPFESYQNGNEISNWETKNIALNKTVESDENGVAKLIVNEKSLAAGFYKVETQGINPQNDTVTLTEIVRIFHSSPAKILTAKEWLVRTDKKAITVNDFAEFRLAGLTEKSKIYYEVYYEDKIEKQGYINVSTQQTLFTVKPQTHYKNAFAVHFFMVNNGTIYNTIETVNIVSAKDELDIQFLSFRDKLQPGEKETWKLLISNKAGEREMAELVATLYDASLDKLKTMSWANSFNQPYNYNIYKWNINAVYKQSRNLWRFNDQTYYSAAQRQYETLNLFNYNYYGGNNYAYKTYLAQLKKKETNELKLAELAKTNLIYGVITDKNNNVLAGVWLKNGKEGSSTDRNGIYSIAGKTGDQLTITYIGYETKRITVGKGKRIDVKLLESNNALNEVVIVGAGEGQVKRALSGSIAGLTVDDGTQVRIRGMASGAVVEDNTVYSFASMDFYDPKTGMRMVNGKPVYDRVAATPRTNFNETAFFYPQLKTNDKGEINVEFTIPQSLTRYKMMGFAHTKDLKSALVSKELITQKQLAVSINAPRFFREGDTIWLSATANNLSGKTLRGLATLTLADALTGNTIDIAKSVLQQNIDLADKGAQILKWQLVIPSNLSAITYKVIATSGKYSDGEEMTIPVLPNSILVTETLPLNVRGNSTKTYNLDKLLNSANSTSLKTQSLTLEYTSNPAWYAVQALPYLMEYPYECAEQTFSRFYANSFATGIVNSSPQIKTVFEQWKQSDNKQSLTSNLEKSQELKNILLEETPWVRQAQNEAERKQRLATLFNLNRMTYELKDNFEKLEKMQMSNGAFPWFAGMREDRYITQHIVMGIGQLQKAKLIDDKQFPSFKTLTNKAIIYLDEQLVKDYNDEIKNNGFSRLPIHYLFARSYFTHQNNNANFKNAFNYYLKKSASSWMTLDTYQQAQVALILFRNNQKADAEKIINLLEQTAQQSEEIGMYWKNNTAGWWWYQNPIETQALLIEAFDEVGNHPTAVEEMKIWLLKNKQTNDWKTTKATTAACYALLMKGYNLLADNQAAEIKLGGINLNDFKTPLDKKEAGTGYEKITIEGTDVKGEMAKIEITNPNNVISWGGLYWQYFENLDKITPSNTGIKIKKQLFLQKNSANGDILTAITNANALKVGDLIKVRIEIYADRAMEYLHLKDMRSSGSEPINVISQYKYQDGLSYYESTKDAATNFFISYMPKGTYLFEYPLRVTHTGNFSNGITSLQSMYASEFTTYSEGIRLSIK